MTYDLQNRTALVTGAGSGIGAATAAALAAAGARVALVGRRADRLATVAAETGGAYAVADVTDRAGLETAVADLRREVGPFDLVVANAGTMLAAPFDAADPSEWDRMIATNVTGLLSTARAAINDLSAAAQEGPADLVLISSIGADVVMPGYAVYFATKAAVTHLTTNLRAEFGPRGVRVRAIEPGMTASELGHDMADQQAQESLRQLVAEIPPISAAAIGDAVVWSSALPVNVNVASMIVLPTVQG
ncbi:Short-chain dehydrogenase/reductase SDR OS=Tsukamurella paurometabola (strain ATCC 8368 / DSM/ CCUG 35730 / CIP 100753 / JCM 10117 / KCTC 9821 / NBRC 16120/ NCIMB 702349 / NCTC 13040) OX=521096 GN=Tpau_3699 PE=3 SV=1 [Tsukamurella paurometabola]|uniref:Short-chain dehydrogenase/reductase SDR n=1 Tax=Tsukamurella paurometabola (strain ATCC 8368 / DSM 20162 / CCUG 35730 / CIP 100753 / JCM 10117 / KCTC 9821 / NBRC 16120 / NCIMB 702349 / NCTC 13040) TaxID=521096 RepID=D5UY40_TSUPD|nr:SDR family NAD(P)-dependent oxidoreductase [Tsukamurella paurometabola]ADG80277.1 short-chain dehydrogenase/reductase SDR [Tsukamurella paurometabola DSM 20162]SUP39111.1 Serine 3-dehydrogenase [Tsukamurella paurometabola]